MTQAIQDILPEYCHIDGEYAERPVIVALVEACPVLGAVYGASPCAFSLDVPQDELDRVTVRLLFETTDRPREYFCTRVKPGPLNRIGKFKCRGMGANIEWIANISEQYTSDGGIQQTVSTEITLRKPR